MNRRTFIKSIVALGVSAAVGGSLFDSAELWSGKELEWLISDARGRANGSILWVSDSVYDKVLSQLEPQHRWTDMRLLEKGVENYLVGGAKVARMRNKPYCT